MVSMLNARPVNSSVAVEKEELDCPRIDTKRHEAVSYVVPVGVVSWIVAATLL
jgi:hypothetical protein